MATLKILETSEELPIELTEIKQFLKIDYEEEDSIIVRSFRTALRQCELLIGCTIVEKKYQYSFYNGICETVKLVYGPVENIELVKMIRKDNTEITINESNYFLDNTADKIVFRNKPDNFYRLDIIYISKLVSISDDLKQAILFHTTKIFEDKTGYSPMPKASYNIYKKYKTKRL
ncbi:MAG: hypothetical protein LBS34_02735 [Rickettsiales bacterium]|jgi:uncharacterized phiE125 gp8 family phage protein|nr:hypothetical protein [Rickettsiales bacterium]